MLSCQPVSSLAALWRTCMQFGCSCVHSAGSTSGFAVRPFVAYGLRAPTRSSACVCVQFDVVRSKAQNSQRAVHLREGSVRHHRHAVRSHQLKLRRAPRRGHPPSPLVFCRWTMLCSPEAHRCRAPMIPCVSQAAACSPQMTLGAALTPIDFFCIMCYSCSATHASVQFSCNFCVDVFVLFGACSCSSLLVVPQFSLLLYCRRRRPTEKHKSNAVHSRKTKRKI